MKAIAITYYTLLRHLRDYKSFIAFIIFPITMMLILGAALSSEFTPKTIEPTQIGYLSEIEGEMDALMQQFLTSEDIKELISVAEINSLEDGIEQVKSSNLKGIVYLTQQEEQIVVQYLSLTEDMIIYPVLESFIQSVNLESIALSMRIEPYSEYRAAVGNAEGLIKEIRIVTEGLIPRGIDYYAITTLFQSLIFGALFGVFSITKDYDNRVYTRLQTAPVSHASIVFGKFIGSVLTLFSIALLIIMIMKFGFKVNYSADLGIILLVLLLFSSIAVGMGMIVAFLSRSMMISALTIFLFSTIFTLVAGGFSPMEGDTVKLLSKFSPNTYAHKILFSNIYEGTLAYSDIWLLLAYTLLVTALVFIIGRRRVA